MKSLYLHFILFELLLISRVMAAGTETLTTDTPLVTYRAHEVSIIDAIKSIEKLTGYTFYFSQKAIAGSVTKSYSFNRTPLIEVLDVLFGPSSLTGIKWEIQGRNIILSKGYQEKSIVENILKEDSVPTRMIIPRLTVVVVDGKHSPIINASVTVADIKNGITNDQGLVVIEDVKVSSILKVSSIGYKMAVYKVQKGDSRIVVRMLEQVTDLKNVEVVSTGYQELQKNKITGSVYKIDNELFNRQPGANVLDRIKYVTSGLVAGGDPMFPDGLTVRGKATFTSSNAPLIVLDNFPYEGNLSNLNPNDVESITVLKDAAAAAIWGARAGNGVIVITTKKGKYNKQPNVTLVANTTIVEKPDLYYLPVMNSGNMIEFEKIMFKSGLYDYYDDLYPQFGYFPAVSNALEAMLEAKRNGVADPTTDPATLARLSKLGSFDIRNDIRKYLMQKESQQQYSASVSGGTDKSFYYASIGYDQIKGSNTGSDNKRVTFDVKNTFRVAKNIEFTIGMGFTKSKSYAPAVNYSSFTGVNVTTSPYGRLKNEDGSNAALPYSYRLKYVDTATYPALLDWHYRPLDELNSSFSTNDGYDTRLFSSLSYRILPWLKTEIQYQGQIAKNDNETVNKADGWAVRNGVNSTMYLDDRGRIQYPWPLGDKIDKYNLTQKNWGARGSIIVDKQIGDHQINTIVGLEYRENKANSFGSSMYGYDPKTSLFIPIDPLTSYTTRPGGGTRTLNDIVMPSGTLFRYGSVYANSIYGFKQRYFVSVSGRVDQSNSFGLKANLRKRPLWSAGVSWNLSEEEFFKSPVVSNLKIRGSFGFTGQTIQGVTSYATMRNVLTELYVPPRPGLTFGKLMSPNNPGLRWERYEIINIGVDFGLWKDRLSGSIEYYKKDGIDLIGPLPADPTTGWTSFTGNGAKIKGKGWDISLISQNLVLGGFSWGSRFLFNYNKNKVVSYADGRERLPIELILSNIDEIGYPQSSLFTYKWAGLDPVDGSPRIFAGDSITSYNKIAKIQKSDLRFVGTKVPKYTGTLINDFKWKRLTLSTAIIYKFDYYFQRSSINYQSLVSAGWSGHEDFSKRWTKKGDETFTDVPAFTLSPSVEYDRAYLSSDAVVEKGDHIRLKDLRIAYSLDEQTLRRLKVFKSLDVYFYMANIGIIWRANDKGIDPDAPFAGSIPSPKSYTFGLTTNF